MPDWLADHSRKARGQMKQCTATILCQLGICDFVIGIPFMIGSLPHPSGKGLGGLIAIEYGDHASLQFSYLLDSKQDVPYPILV